mmetsp:Transcript_8733/g.15840  ORF Transcript_8733/g.15840 Transcript_8733/m.15840 type:complete len:224 (+) Transcript_8733:400-1071(+)
MLGSQLVNGLLDNSQTTGFAHALGRNVGMHTSTVPVSINNGLRVEGAVHLELLAHTLKDVSAHLKLISSINSDTGSNLVFLLSRHDLSIRSRDLEASVEAGTIHGISDSTSERVFGTGTAVVRSLGTGGDTTLGPAKGGALVEVEEGEFLFEAEPGFLVVLAFEGSGGNSPGVGRNSLSRGSVTVAHDQDVVSSILTWAERILEDPARSQDNLGIISRRLASG